jgi:glutathione S-transferase
MRMTGTFLMISSKNYSSWSLRGWLLCRIAGLDFVEEVVPADDPANRAELLLLSPSILVPCLTHGGIRIWDTLAIAEYLNEVKPKGRLLPAERAARARCRSICGEMHSGFTNLRSALPMNLKAHRPGFKMVRSAGGHRPHYNDLERVFRGSPRSVSVREIDDGRRDVRACRHPLLDLRREARSSMRWVL